MISTGKALKVDVASTEDHTSFNIEIAGSEVERRSGQEHVQVARHVRFGPDGIPVRHARHDGTQVNAAGVVIGKL
ncbi:hypothetical protein [Micromonospora maritima]|uniref:hypothetical protein n=1 Tax=Micromonospora maritima TaxID=986711 RepID=UPI0037B23400